jgi:hypothetical protein
MSFQHELTVIATHLHEAKGVLDGPQPHELTDCQATKSHASLVSDRCAVQAPRMIGRGRLLKGKSGCPVDLQLSPMAPTASITKGMSTNHVEPKTGNSSLHLLDRGRGGGQRTNASA